MLHTLSDTHTHNEAMTEGSQDMRRWLAKNVRTWSNSFKVQYKLIDLSRWLSFDSYCLRAYKRIWLYFAPVRFFFLNLKSSDDNYCRPYPTQVKNQIYVQLWMSRSVNTSRSLGQCATHSNVVQCPMQADLHDPTTIQRTTNAFETSRVDASDKIQMPKCWANLSRDQSFWACNFVFSDTAET